MSPGVEVRVERNAVPIVRVVAAMARRSLNQPNVATQVARVRGIVALQSATDPQAATLRIAGNAITVERGVADDAQVIITADLTDSAAKPKLEGAARHPMLALAAGKLLEPPIGPWTAEADRFVTAALASSACPRPIRVVCTDDGELRQWGGDGEPTIEFHGPADALASAMSGSSVITEDVLAGHIDVVGTLKDLAVLSRFAIEHLFGEL